MHRSHPADTWNSGTSLEGFRPLVGLALLALGACSLTFLIGLPVALTYTDQFTILREWGITLQHLRPIHESCAFAWVFIGGVATVHLWLVQAHGPPDAAMRKRTLAMVTLWTAAGVGIVISLLCGHFTGREYLGYSPVFSVLIASGWLLFAWNFYARVGWSLKGRPVYVIMWWVAIPLFLITYAEAHAYLLEYVSLRPLRDLAIQWKSAGAHVGSFNLLAYGSLMFVACALQGNESYAHSRTAFTFFTVGLLNTFCNYGHHTYHLPQSAWIHWISFIVSMLELAILAKVFLDVGKLLKLLKGRTGATSHPVIEGFMRSATLWTFLMLTLSIVIAVPPLNAMVHGTHVISAHVMGSMVGIDSMILWAAMGYLVSRVVGADHVSLQKPSICKAVRLTNVFLFAFILVYLLRGASAGWSRYAGAAASDYSEWVALFPTLMMVFGAGLMVSVLWVLLHWICALLASRNPA
ncbi:MAG: cbb3-type cytochrome c oxidase subunit I [Planctomycetota bacterium]|jgi:nitric oxide reductase subunit B|nr:cbb3-type cytochrome c oxidase subunit I [Planctomycetota bacterium]MDP6939717.1 cbb3-type cytochrome c oxidase subunit I [Planctomycetota bacterium]